MSEDIALKEKAVLRGAAEFALDVLMNCVRAGEGCDDEAARKQAIMVLRAALLASGKV